jgi:DNA gyrase subunit A
MNKNELLERIKKADIRKVMSQKFLDYGMSVIVDRALPDIRDGLKPVHRRIIYAMHVLGNRHNAPYKKSARIVGDVIGKYHPHGDTAVYDSMVRMAQPFSMRVALVDGQGNFGSVDGDSPAAMRYTESRMTTFTEQMLADIDRGTIDFHDNYDGSEKIPTVLPTPYPNLLINGSIGIAVGMATNIPTHNPMEVMACVLKAIEHGGEVKKENIQEFLEIMPAPDFPTGGIVHDLQDMEQIWTEGYGRVQLRAKWHKETTDSDKASIIITEIPYLVNKNNLMKKIAELVNPDKNKIVQVEGVSDFRDESDKDGMRIFIEVKRDSDPDVVFNSLAKATQLNESFNYNTTVLVNNNPKQVGLMTVINEFILHRLEVIERRTMFLDNKARVRHHLLAGFMKALDPDSVEKVIEMIRFSKNNAEAKMALIKYLSIDDIQADAILDMKLQKLASSEVDKLKAEYDNIVLTREGYATLLNSKDERFKLIVEETNTVIESFKKGKDANGDKTYGVRLSEVRYEPMILDMAALIKEEECTVILTAEGFARRIPLEEMEQQNRGTRGKSQMKLRDEDFIIQSLSSHSHAKLMGITKSGKCFVLDAFEITDSQRGKYINTIAEIDNDEKVIMLMPVNYESGQDLVLITKSGKIMKSALENYKNAKRKGGVKAITLDEGNEVIHATLSKDVDDMVLVNTANKIIRFNINQIRRVSRGSKGVTGMRIKDSGDIIGGDVVTSENIEASYIVTVSDKGMVKITSLDQYKIQKHGGMGVLAMKATGKVGDVFKAMIVSDLSGELIVTTKKGVSNRISLSKVTVTSRTTRGVKLVKIDVNDNLADVFFYKDVSPSEDENDDELVVFSDSKVVEDEFDSSIIIDDQEQDPDELDS